MTEIDNLVADLAGSFQVTDEAHSTSKPHPRFASYKTLGYSKEDCQNKRRSELLEQQKKKRCDAMMLARQIALDEDDYEQESMDVTRTKTKNNVWKGTGQKKPLRYRDQLMLSEWLVDVPEDLEENWLMVPCPEGKRCLVVASRKWTHVYNKGGYKLYDFESDLPGGGRHSKKSEYSLLDCVYSDLDQTFYVLDIMCWASTSFYENDTEVRFFFSQSKMAERTEVSEWTKTNPYPFVFLPRCSCSKSDIETMMRSEFPFKSKLDGLLFYLKCAQYWQGRTPLVTWLKPFMLPEMLSVSVPAHFMEGHESETAAAFREEFDSNLNKRKEKRLHQDENTMKADGDKSTDKSSDTRIDKEIDAMEESTK